ncbi:Cysteine-rich protein 2-binding protein, partial [Cladochytrium tenue]
MDRADRASSDSSDFMSPPPTRQTSRKGGRRASAPRVVPPLEASTADAIASTPRAHTVQAADSTADATNPADPEDVDVVGGVTSPTDPVTPVTVLPYKLGTTVYLGLVPECARCTGESLLLFGDEYYSFCCSVCGSGTQSYQRKPMKWLDVVSLALRHLTVSAKQQEVFFRSKEDICRVIAENWDHITPGRSKGTAWQGTVSGILSAHIDEFDSGIERLGVPGWWGLREFTSKLPSPQVPLAHRKKRKASSVALDAGYATKFTKIDETGTNELGGASQDSQTEPEGVADIPSTATAEGTTSGERPPAAASPKAVAADRAADLAGPVTPARKSREAKTAAEVTVAAAAAGGVGERGLMTGDDDDFDDETEGSLAPQSSLTRGEQGLPPRPGASDAVFQASRRVLVNYPPANTYPAKQSVPSTAALATPTATLPAVSTSTTKAPLPPPLPPSPPRPPSQAGAAGVVAAKVTTAPSPPQQQLQPMTTDQCQALLRELDALLLTRRATAATAGHTGPAPPADVAAVLTAAARLRRRVQLLLHRPRAARRRRLDLDAAVAAASAAAAGVTGAAAAVDDRPVTWRRRAWRAAPDSRVLPSRRRPLPVPVVWGETPVERCVWERYRAAGQLPPGEAALTRPLALRVLGACGDGNEVVPVESPYTGAALPRFIRRDSSMRPAMRRVLDAVRCNTALRDGEAGQGLAQPPATVDFVHLRAELVADINELLARLFWPGIDVSEHLQAPDYTVVALHGRLVVGCGLMTEAGYITYVCVRPGWRGAGIARFMLFQLLKSNPTVDITLHVSANNPAL